MIIDSLTHVTADGKWFNTSYDAGLEALIESMDQCCVDQAVVVALADYIDNEITLSACARHPGRLYPGASLNPVAYPSPYEAGEATKRILGDGQFAVLKLHPRLNGYDPLCPNSLAVMEVLQELGIPLWLDTMFRNGKCLLSKPPVETVHDMAQRFPELPMVLLHGGGPLLLQMADLLTGHPNLTVDMSLTLPYYKSTSIYDDILFLLEKRDRRICVGSDFPEYRPVDYLDLMAERAGKVEISQDKMDNILGGNLKQILSGYDFGRLS